MNFFNFNFDFWKIKLHDLYQKGGALIREGALIRDYTVYIIWYSIPDHISYTSSSYFDMSLLIMHTKMQPDTAREGSPSLAFFCGGLYGDAKNDIILWKFSTENFL